MHLCCHVLLISFNLDLSWACRPQRSWHLGGIAVRYFIQYSCFGVPGISPRWHISFESLTGEMLCVQGTTPRNMSPCPVADGNFDHLVSVASAWLLHCWKKICLRSKTPVITSRRKARNRKSPFGRPHWDLPGGSDGEECACKAGDLSLIPGSGGSPGSGNGSPLQYSLLENPMDRGAWPATVHGVTKSGTRLSP